ncbi:hypothetical protein TNCV_2390671 [Trichonephila clavipes]|nr:hypothetical protein TNCV_2390671 [Trichonephila clavipes]
MVSVFGGYGTKGLNLPLSYKKAYNLSPAQQYDETILRLIVLSFEAHRPRPVFKPMMSGPIRLAHLWTPFMPLIFFFDQQGHQTFHQSNMSGIWQGARFGHPKISQTWSKNR